MSRGEQRSQQGFILLPIALALALIAAAALLINRESGMGVELAGSRAQGTEAYYVARAGLHHANWLVQQRDCSGYTDIVGASLGDHTYDVTITPTSGSPVTMSATGTARGAVRSLVRNNVRVYTAPVSNTLQPDADAGKDTFLYDWKPSWNYGAHRELWVTEQAGNTYRPLLQFDLGAIPTGVKLISAVLELYQNSPSTNGGPVGAYRVTSDWVEGAKTGGTGAGANWNERDTALPWAAPGGDVDATPVGITTIANRTLAWYEWDVTALVADWVAGTAPNNGLALIGENASTVAYFASSDDTDPTLHPKLIITYACDCSSGGSGNTLTLQPGPEGEDVYIASGGTQKNRGAFDTLAVKPAQEHTLVRFDLSWLPAGATVTAAQFELYVSSLPTYKGPTDYHVHRVTQDWVEGTAATGSDPVDGATWDTYDGVNLWAAPGGDFDPTVEASTSLRDPNVEPAEGWYTWDVTGLVASWVTGTPNYGLLVSATGANNGPKIRSGDHAIAAHRPKLTITYSCQCGVDCSSAPPPPPPPASVYRDEFNSRICDAAVDYIGSDGTLDWSPWAWSEIGDDGAPCAGNVTLTEDPEVIEPANYRLQISGNANGITRQADLAAFPSATMSFRYRRANVNNNNYLSVSVSDNGGDTWTELDRLEGPAADADYLTASYDISGYISGNTAVRFLSESFGILETIYIDDVQIDDTAGGGPPATGSPLTLNPTIDTWIDENSPDAAHGTDDRFQTGANAAWLYCRSLLQFDVSSVPAGATVTSATLRLYTTDEIGKTDGNIAVYRVTTPWDETATWNSTGGQPYDPAGPGEPLAVTTVPWVTGVWVEWSLPPGLIHEWIDGVSPNYGLILNYEGSKKNQWVRSATREHAAAEWHPQLVLEYTEP